MHPVQVFGRVRPRIPWLHGLVRPALPPGGPGEPL